mmetsp:Transcript_20068/g.50912  ORF Transcript_20068/g.50912 Transcript_20068/m.50912 type:complete len:200 (+) Transcript_20068:757-1356(+)
MGRFKAVRSEGSSPLALCPHQLTYTRAHQVSPGCGDQREIDRDAVLFTDHPVIDTSWMIEHIASTQGDRPLSFRLHLRIEGETRSLQGVDLELGFQSACALVVVRCMSSHRMLNTAIHKVPGFRSFQLDRKVLLKVEMPTGFVASTSDKGFYLGTSITIAEASGKVHAQITRDTLAELIGEELGCTKVQGTSTAHTGEC